MLTVVGRDGAVVASNDLSIRVTAAGDASIAAGQRLEVRAGADTANGNTIDGTLIAESRTAFAHARGSDADTMRIGGNAVVLGATMAGLQADVAGNATVIGPEGAVFLGATGGNLGVAAANGSAHVDGQPMPAGAGHADIGGDLRVTALDAMYRRIATDDAGFGAALREAQQELRRRPETSHPTYWAAFVLVGDGTTQLYPERGGTTAARR